MINSEATRTAVILVILFPLLTLTAYLLLRHVEDIARGSEWIERVGWKVVDWCQRRGRGRRKGGTR